MDSQNNQKYPALRCAESKIYLYEESWYQNIFGAGVELICKGFE